MNTERIHTLLTQYKRGTLSEHDVIESLARGFVEPNDFATIDHHRELRQGAPEVILAEGKTPAQVASIARSIVRHGSVLLATRASQEHYTAVRKVVRGARYNKLGRTITANERLIRKHGRGTILVVTAGTADLPVAEEALVTARILGNDTDKLVDVGVAGIHRLLTQTDKLRKASVVIVVAGMEGALPSVVGGLVRVPVIAVPTSVGYGANFGGITALLAMLNSCAAGVTVVNINNGFGAAFAASLINRAATDNG